MTTITEYQLFKMCVEAPVRLEKDLGQLNLNFITDPNHDQSTAE